MPTLQKRKLSLEDIKAAVRARREECDILNFGAFDESKHDRGNPKTHNLGQFAPKGQGIHGQDPSHPLHDMATGQAAAPDGPAGPQIKQPEAPETTPGTPAPKGLASLAESVEGENQRHSTQDANLAQSMQSVHDEMANENVKPVDEDVASQANEKGHIAIPFHPEHFPALKEAYERHAGKRGYDIHKWTIKGKNAYAHLKPTPTPEHIGEIHADAQAEHAQNRSEAGSHTKSPEEHVAEVAKTPEQAEQEQLQSAHQAVARGEHETIHPDLIKKDPELKQAIMLKDHEDAAKEKEQQKIAEAQRQADHAVAQSAESTGEAPSKEDPSPDPKTQPVKEETSQLPPMQEPKPHHSPQKLADAFKKVTEKPKGAPSRKSPMPDGPIQGESQPAPKATPEPKATAAPTLTPEQKPSEDQNRIANAKRAMEDSLKPKAEPKAPESIQQKAPEIPADKPTTPEEVRPQPGTASGETQKPEPSAEISKPQSEPTPLESKKPEPAQSTIAPDRNQSDVPSETPVPPKSDEPATVREATPENTEKPIPPKPVESTFKPLTSEHDVKPGDTIYHKSGSAMKVIGKGNKTVHYETKQGQRLARHYREFSKTPPSPANPESKADNERNSPVGASVQGRDANLTPIAVNRDYRVAPVTRAETGKVGGMLQNRHGSSWIPSSRNRSTSNELNDVDRSMMESMEKADESPSSVQPQSHEPAQNTSQAESPDKSSGISPLQANAIHQFIDSSDGAHNALAEIDRRGMSLSPQERQYIQNISANSKPSQPADASPKTKLDEMKQTIKANRELAESPLIHGSAQDAPDRGVYRINTRYGERYAVRDANNKNGFGDTVHETPEAASKYANELEVQRARTSKWKDEAKAREDAAAAEKLAKSDIGDYGKDLSPRARGIAAKVLNTLVRMNGEAKPLKEHIKALVDGGAELGTREEDRIKPMSRTQYNRASNEEQRAHEKRIAEGGKKTVYTVGGYDLGKTAYDYARHLKAGLPEVATADVSPSEPNLPSRPSKAATPEGKQSADLRKQAAELRKQAAEHNRQTQGRAVRNKGRNNIHEMDRDQRTGLPKHQGPSTFISPFHENSESAAHSALIRQAKELNDKADALEGKQKPSPVSWKYGDGITPTQKNHRQGILAQAEANGSKYGIGKDNLGNYYVVKNGDSTTLGEKHRTFGQAQKAAEADIQKPIAADAESSPPLAEVQPPVAATPKVDELKQTIQENREDPPALKEVKDTIANNRVGRTEPISPDQATQQGFKPGSIYRSLKNAQLMAKKLDRLGVSDTQERPALEHAVIKNADGTFTLATRRKQTSKVETPTEKPIAPPIPKTESSEEVEKRELGKTQSDIEANAAAARARVAARRAANSAVTPSGIAATESGPQEALKSHIFDEYKAMGGKLGRDDALHYARNTDDPKLKFMVAVHDTMPSRPVAQEQLSKGSLTMDDKFKINGVDVTVGKNEHGQWVIKDHGELPETPIDELPAKIPVDAGSMHKSELPSVEGQYVFPGTQDDVAKTMKSERQAERVMKATGLPHEEAKAAYQKLVDAAIEHAKKYPKDNLQDIADAAIENGNTIDDVPQSLVDDAVKEAVALHPRPEPHELSKEDYWESGPHSSSKEAYATHEAAVDKAAGEGKIDWASDLGKQHGEDYPHLLEKHAPEVVAAERAKQDEESRKWEEEHAANQAKNKEMMDREEERRRAKGNIQKAYDDAVASKDPKRIRQAGRALKIANLKPHEIAEHEQYKKLLESGDEAQKIAAQNHIDRIEDPNVGVGWITAALRIEPLALQEAIDQGVPESLRKVVARNAASLVSLDPSVKTLDQRVKDEDERLGKNPWVEKGFAAIDTLRHIDDQRRGRYLNEISKNAEHEGAVEAAVHEAQKADDEAQKADDKAREFGQILHEQAVERSKNLKHDPIKGSVKHYLSNVVEPGQYISDGRVLIDTQSASAKGMMKKLMDKSAKLGRGRLPQSAAKELLDSFSEQSKDKPPLEDLGHTQVSKVDDRTIRYFADPSGNVFGVDGNLLANLKEATDYNELRLTDSHGVMVAYKGGKPVGVISCINTREIPVHPEIARQFSPKPPEPTKLDKLKATVRAKRGRPAAKAAPEPASASQPKPSIEPMAGQKDAADDADTRNRNPGDLEEDAHDFISAALASKRPPKDAEEAWQQYRRNIGAETDKGTPTHPEEKFKRDFETYLHNHKKDKELSKAASSPTPEFKVKQDILHNGTPAVFEGYETDPATGQRMARVELRPPFQAVTRKLVSPTELQSKQIDKVPEHVRWEVYSRLKNALDANQKLHESRQNVSTLNFKTNKYEPVADGPEQSSLAEKAKAANESLEEFRQNAEKSGIDFDKLIDEEGGVEPRDSYGRRKKDVEAIDRARAEKDAPAHAANQEIIDEDLKRRQAKQKEIDDAKKAGEEKKSAALLSDSKRREEGYHQHVKEIHAALSGKAMTDERHRINESGTKKEKQGLKNDIMLGLDTRNEKAVDEALARIAEERKAAAATPATSSGGEAANTPVTPEADLSTVEQQMRSHGTPLARSGADRVRVLDQEMQKSRSGIPVDPDAVFEALNNYGRPSQAAALPQGASAAINKAGGELLEKMTPEQIRKFLGHVRSQAQTEGGYNGFPSVIKDLVNRHGGSESEQFASSISKSMDIAAIRDIIRRNREQRGLGRLGMNRKLVG